MTIEIINRVLEHSKQKGNVRLVATILAHLADRNGHIDPDVQLVADRAGTDPRNVRLAIKALVESRELVPASIGGYTLMPEKSRGEVIRQADGALLLRADQVIRRQNGSGDPQNGSGDPQNGSGDPQNGSGDPQNGSGDPRLKNLLIKDSLSSKESSGEKSKTPRQPADDRANHPAIQAMRDLMNCYPHKANWDDLIKTLGDKPDLERLTNCFKLWTSRSNKPVNIAWALEWYLPGVLEKKSGNSNASYRSSAPASNRPDSDQLQRDLDLKRQREASRQ